MGYRRFIAKFIGLLILFVGINALIWFAWVREIPPPEGKGGDLVRMGYISGLTVPRQEITDLPHRHIDIRQYDKTAIDMVTMGDSFSDGGGYGRNSYYQDYIASIHGLRVLYVPSYQYKGRELRYEPAVTLSKLINSGYLDVMKPRYLLVESIERLAIPRFAQKISLDENATIDEIDRYLQENTFVNPLNKDLELKFINNGNWKFLANTIQYRFRDHALGNKVLMTRLTKPLFSSKLGDRLLFYQEDLLTAAVVTPQTVATLNSNLNQVAAILRKKGITLIFMPIVDKLDLYHPYLVDRRYPQSNFFEELRKLPKEYMFIDTKAILAPLLEKGVLDVFFQDDTHWTRKASQAIFENVRFGQKDQ